MVDTNWVTVVYHNKKVKKLNTCILKKETPIFASVALFEKVNGSLFKMLACRFHKIK
jgi:hypothetical protein